MRSTAVIIGAGQAGLAMSHELTRRDVDHVLLEAGSVAHAWRTQRWDSLRLLTPNWLSRLPGWTYAGPHPDGYMTARELADHLGGYARSLPAPIIEHTTVSDVRPAGRGFEVATSQGRHQCRLVFDASGACRVPRRPGLSAALPATIRQIDAIHYRRAKELEGPVLVVGGSASGAQIADELARSGHQVALAVGNHIRVPRRYRGHDIHRWLDRAGVLDERIEDTDDPVKARRTPSLQLVGTSSGRDLDIATLGAAGVHIVGRLVGATDDRFQFSGSLANTLRSADLKLDRLLDRFDELATLDDWDESVEAVHRPFPTPVPSTRLDLAFGDVRTVVWATGFNPHHPWLPDAVLDRRGHLQQVGGVTALPGLYALGLPFGIRRKSAFIDGVGPDAAEIATAARDHLDAPGRLLRS